MSHERESPPVLLVERENHVDRRVYFDRVAVQQRRLVLPLPHCVERRLHQQRMPRHDFEFPYRAVLADDRVKPHSAGDASLTRERRIDRLDTIDQRSRSDVAALTNTPRRNRLRWWWCSANAANHATNYAAHLAARHTARNTTRHSRKIG